MIYWLDLDTTKGSDPKYLFIPVVIIGLSILWCLIDYLVKKIKRRNKKIAQ
ncbi:hypothetical protein [Spiroplasma endosymbiont of Nebria brevicollis]|uniref:hypothetical protein n=1 Tax=Spiroplasma endosymbiont of Nebria brevicollis TaxID=3066284 RepID=UPI00313B6BF2